MKIPTRLLIVTSSAALLVLLYQRQQSDPVFASTSPASAVSPAVASATTGSASNQSPVPAPNAREALPANQAAAVPAPTALPAVPDNIKDLNQMADGPFPLPARMAVLSKLMMDAPPDLAKAAAVRSVFVVRNADYASQLQPLLVAGEMKREALDVLSLNLYDRPLEIQLPALAAIRDRAGHPLHAMASDALVFHLKDKGHASGETLAQNVRAYLTPPAP